jgi:hypothetical protein
MPAFAGMMVLRFAAIFVTENLKGIVQRGECEIKSGLIRRPP